MLPTIEKATTVAVVNKQQIVIVLKDGDELVPVRPFSDALGLNFSGQHQRINRDPILSSTVCTVHTVGGDEKNREMVAIPLKFTFGWLFTIEVNQVKEEARQAVLQYQLECYDALYDHFISYRDFDRYKNERLLEKLADYDYERDVFRSCKDRIKNIRDEIDELRQLSYADFLQLKKQLPIEFPE